MSTAGRTVVFSALTVAAAMLSLVVFPQQFLKSIGIGGAVVALVAASVALLILPALFARMGTRLMPRGGVPNPAQTRWARITATVLRRPGTIAAVTAVAMVLVAIPTLRAQWTGVDAGILPTSHSARVVDDRLAADYPQLSADPVVIAVHAPAERAPAVERYAAASRASAACLGLRAPAPRRIDVADRRRRPGLAARRHGAERGEGHPRPVAAVRRRRRRQRGALRRRPRRDRRPACRSPWPSSWSTTLVLLWLMTGSAVLPIKALVMSFLTLGVTTGVLVLVFQDGRFESLLGYTSQGGIEEADFLVLAAIAFAISTDYGVFVTGRIKEAHDRGLSQKRAITTGIGATGRLVSAAAVLLAVAMGAFATSQIVFLKEIGVGAVVAVLVDAFVVRALLVPSLMALLGDRNWWSPRVLRRLHARVGLSEGAPAAA